MPAHAESRPDDFATTLAHWAARLSYTDLPAEVVAAARTNLFDTLACAAAGSSAAGVAAVRELAVSWGGAPQATVLGFGDRLSAHHAAWVNGMIAHARDYDDTHDAAVLHAGVSVVPAALAAAELRGGVPGPDFVAAIAAGLETISRIGVATRIGIIESGWMYTALFGHFAATIAAGRVLGLDPAQMVDALGIVYSQVAGNHQVTRDGALTKRMQPGFAAKAALLSVQLAQRGIRGTRGTFEGEDGFLRVYLHDRCDRERLRDGLGTRWEFVDLSYKPYPCCRFNHNAIDAALALRAAHGIDVARVRRIRVGVNRQAYEAVCTPVAVRKAPTSIVLAQFSIPYTVAAALVDGEVGLRHFSDAALRRPDLLAVAQRVDAEVDEAIERDWERTVSPVHLEIEMSDGTVHVERVDWPLGHPRRPMTPAQFDRKAADCFRAAAHPLGDDAARRLRHVTDRLEALDDVRALVRVLDPTMTPET